MQIVLGGSVCFGTVRKMRPNRSSKYKGVSWNQFRNKWSGNIRINRVLKCKMFETELEAAQWYNEMVVKHFDLSEGKIIVLGTSN